MEKLDSRKMRILQIIIQNYLETGEPVGSRTIAKYSDLNISPATIRNEMSDLEELGYIVQPHTSAGRIPSDKGYRLYVDTMMEDKERQVTQMQEMVIEKADKLEKILQQIAKVLANNTNYATMITAPRLQHNKLKFIQLSNLDTEHVLAVIVVEGNLMKNRIIEVEEPLDNETCLRLNMLLNTNLNGLVLEQITLGMIAKIKEQAGDHRHLISEILDAVAEAIQVESDMEIYTSGATNILKYPELSDSEKARELISAFEEKQQLAGFVIDQISENESNTEIQVYIGNESPIQTMKDCSVVTATYQLGDGMMGTVGIIGPKRMDYENVVGNLKTLKHQLDELFKNT